MAHFAMTKEKLIARFVRSQRTTWRLLISYIDAEQASRYMNTDNDNEIRAQQATYLLSVLLESQ